MQVEMSLAELLINAIAQGRVAGVQFKRGWSDEKATFADLNIVIEDRLIGARQVAIQEALYKLREEHPMFKLLAEVERLREALRAIAELPVGGRVPHSKHLAEKALAGQSEGEDVP